MGIIDEPSDGCGGWAKIGKDIIPIIKQKTAIYPPSSTEDAPVRRRGRDDKLIADCLARLPNVADDVRYAVRSALNRYVLLCDATLRNPRAFGLHLPPVVSELEKRLRVFGQGLGLWVGKRADPRRGKVPQ